MKFGFHVFTPQPKKENPEEVIDAMIAQTRTVRDNGFDFLWTGQHFVMEDLQQYQMVSTLSRLAAESGDMHLGGNVLLPLLSPVEVAEQFATMDAVTNGKIILGPAAGYRDKEFEAFGIPKHQRGKRMAESVRIIKRLWTEDSVTFDGNHYQFRDISINPKPIQDPRPPIWMAGNSNEAVKRASKLGDAWMPPPHSSEDEKSNQFSLINSPSGTGYRGHQPLLTDVYVAETDQKAINIYRPYIEEFYDWYKKEGQHKAMENPETINIREFGLDRFIIGSPKTVVERILHLREEWGIDALIMIMSKPGITDNKTLNSIELMGEKVIPQVHTELE